MVPIIKLNKSALIKLVILLLIGLFLFWFVGWKSIRYDKDDEEIGRKVVFTAPMVIVKLGPGDMAESFLTEKLNVQLWEQVSWKNISSSYPNAMVNKMKCQESFYVKEVFYVERHGLVAKAFGIDLKHYVLSSSKDEDLVILRGDYDEYSSNDFTTPFNCSTE